MHNDHMAVTHPNHDFLPVPPSQICSAALFPFPRIANKHLIAPSLTFLAPPSTRISQSCCFLAEPIPSWEVQQIGVPTSLCELRPLVFPRSVYGPLWGVVFPRDERPRYAGPPGEELWVGYINWVCAPGLNSPKYASTTQSECIRSEISTASLPSP
jgi:hypothetical protein